MSSSYNPQFEPRQPANRSQSVPDTEELQITFPGIIDITETLRVAQIASGTYLLQDSSAFGEVYYGDLIEVLRDASGANQFVRVVSRSGLCVKTFILPETAFASDGLKRLLDRVVSLGGVWERAYGGVLFVHLPTGLDMDLDQEVQSLRA